MFMQRFAQTGWVLKNTSTKKVETSGRKGFFLRISAMKESTDKQINECTILKILLQSVQGKVFRA